MRQGLALALSFFAVLPMAPGHNARAAEAVDPGATWAPPSDREEPAPAEAPQAATATAEDDSVSQGQRASPPSLSTAPAPQAKPKVAVVILHQALGKPFDMSVISRIMEPLVPHAAFVPLPLVKKAVGHTGLPPQLLHLPKNLQKVGQAVGADFTLVIEAVGHGRSAGVFAGLVDVHSGETTVAKRVPMPTRALTNSQAIVLVDLIVNALAPAPGAQSGEPAAVADAGQQGAEHPADLAAEHPTDHKDEEPAAEPKRVAAEDPNGLHGPRAARLMIGLALSQRVAHLIDTQHTGITPPQYAGSGNNTNPIFPGFQLDAEIYSGIVTKHRRRWYDNFGLGLSLTLAPVLSYTEDTTTDAITKIHSTVTRIDAFALYRVLFRPSKPLTPSLTLQLGVNRFAFPLGKAQFPGVAFMAPHIGLDLQVPLHKMLLLRVGGALRPGVSPSGEAKTLLGQKSGGLGFVADGGLIASWRIFDAGLKVQFEKTSLKYKGATSLYGTPTVTGATTPVQFTNIKLTDQLLQILLTAGIAF